MLIAFVGIGGLIVNIAFTYLVVDDNTARLQAIKTVYFPIIEKVDACAARLENIKKSFTEAISVGETTFINDAQADRDAIHVALEQIAISAPDKEEISKRLENDFDAYFAKNTELAEGIISGSLKPIQLKSAVDAANVSLEKFESDLLAFRNNNFQAFSNAIEKTDLAAQSTLVVGIIVAVAVAFFLILATFVVITTISRNFGKTIGSLNAIASGAIEPDSTLGFHLDKTENGPKELVKLGEALAAVTTRFQQTEKEIRDLNFSLQASDKRLREHNRLILITAKSDYLTAGDIDNLFSEVATTTCQGLNVPRASVWLYDHDCSQLECIQLFEQEKDKHSSGTALKAEHFQRYFGALSTEHTIVANDVDTHPATSELGERYLAPLGIKSMLSIAINVGGKVAGVICCEHVGRAHKWSPEEIAFARSMADFASLALETREREKAQLALDESEGKFDILSRTTDSAIIVFRDQFLYTNPAFQRMTGYTHDELLRRRFVDLVVEDAKPIVSHLTSQYEQGLEENIREELRIIDKEGDERWLFLTSGLIQYEGRPAGLATAFDITKRKRMEDQLRHQAFHDKLTGLPNRALFIDRLEQAIIRGNRRKRQFAVLFIDLDRFKPINDSLGHLVGDDLLREVARRLQHKLRAEDTITRLGGDEFTVLLEDLHNSENAITIAEKIQDTISKPCLIESNEVIVTASIGIAMYDASYKSAENMLRDADIAMYRAKTLGKGRHAIFDSSMHARAVQLLELEGALRRAIERAEFELYYQPIVNLKTGRISAFEALIRWNHPQRGLVSPFEFIPIAEDTGLINDIGDWLLKGACRLLKSWRQQVPKDSMPTININVSSRQIAYGDLVEKVVAALTEAKISGDNLKLELTESVVMDNPVMASSMITELKQYHVQTAIDDFGTGYSSLSYLHQFPIDTLKIDRSFISELQSDGVNAEIVNTIVMLAHNLSLDVVAEGIEEAHQLEHLRSVGCDYAQGYYFAKPMPASDALKALLTEVDEIDSVALS